MEQRLSLVTLGVANLKRSRRFYERLGWRPSSASSAAIAFYQLAGIALALYPRDDLAKDARLPAEGQGFGGITLAFNARTRAEVDAVLAEAQAAGARILKSAEEAFWGGYSGYFADPDGYPWEVCWNPGFTVMPDGSLRLPE
ncbi:MAG: VOC family protein [Acidobacteriaceae bacterium]